MGFKAVQFGVWHAEDDFFNAVKKQDDVELLILVEPFPHHEDVIRRCYAGYNYELVQKAIVADEAISEITMYASNDGGAYGAVSSFSESHVTKHGVGVMDRCVLPAITATKLFEEYKITELDLLAVDIEGLDVDVITSIDLDKFKIKRICYEHLHCDNARLDAYLTEYGYSLVHDSTWETPWDSIYERN